MPIFEYDRMHEHWWSRQQVAPDITWPGRPNFFALSSGTTGKESKRIPITEDMLKSIRSVSMAQLSSLANFDLPPEVFEKEVLALGSSTQLKKNRDHLEGEISGINASQAPFWFNFFYRPGPQIASIDNWDERVEAIVREARDWDIGVLIGIPPWVQLMIKSILEHYELDSIHDIWPDLHLYVTGGVAFEPFRQSFENCFSHPVFYQDTYLASEGYFAYNARPDTTAMRLALQHKLFLEFIPFDSSGFDETGKLLPDPKVLTISEIEEDKDYALLASTPAGAWRYMIGDTVKFTNKKKREIIISGRTKYFMNVVGSQLSEEKMNRAIKELSENTGVQVNEYSLSAMQDEKGEYFHQWVLGLDKKGDEVPELAQQLDGILKNLNKNYAVARGKALKYIQVKSVSKQLIYAWLEKGKKKGGQVKFPKIMKAERMRDLLQFLDSQS